MRIGQSQVTEKAVAELARANAFSVIWRANATRECIAFSKMRSIFEALPVKWVKWALE